MISDAEKAEKHRAADRDGAYPAGPADVERAGGKFSRQVAGRRPAGELVRELVRGQEEDGGLAGFCSQELCAVRTLVGPCRDFRSAERAQS